MRIIAGALALITTFRDGIEDCQYLDLLQRRAGPQPDASVRRLLNLAALCPSGWQYPHDPEAMLQRRDTIARAVEAWK